MGPATLKHQGEPSDVLPMDGLTSDALAVAHAVSELLAASPHALVAALDATGNFVDLPAFVAAAGHGIRDSRSALDLLAADDRALVVQTWQRAQETGTAATTVRLATEPGGQAQLHFFVVRAEDVTIAVLAADGLGGLVTSSVENTLIAPRVALQRKNERGVFIEIDDATTRMLGWERTDAVGRTALSFVHPDDQKRAIDVWFDMIGQPGASGRARLRMQHADGRWLWCEITNHNLLHDPDHGYVATETLDITDEMAAHEAVRARELLLRRIAETIPLGLLQCDEHGDVVYTNERLGEILGGATAPGARDPLSHVVACDRERLHEMLAASLDDAVDRDLEVRVAAGDSERLCRTNIRALVDHGDAITGAIVCIEDVTEHARLHAELRTRATFDALTNCLNRAAILEELNAMLAISAAVGVIFVDLDDFKRVNDDHGHAVGDWVIAEAAERIRSAIRVRDIVGRLGGDEFLVVCPDITHERDAVAVAERISGALSHIVRVDGHSLTLRASTGVATSRAGALRVDQIVALADRAMYSSKADGRGLPVVFDATGHPVSAA